MLPNVVAPLSVAVTLGIAGAILTEAGLSFLGLSVQVPTPTWGNMLLGCDLDFHHREQLVALVTAGNCDCRHGAGDQFRRRWVAGRPRPAYAARLTTAPCKPKGRRDVETTDFNNSYMTWSAESQFRRHPQTRSYALGQRGPHPDRCPLHDHRQRRQAWPTSCIWSRPAAPNGCTGKPSMIQNPSGEYRQIFSEPARAPALGRQVDLESGDIAHGPAVSTEGFNWIQFTISLETVHRRLATERGRGRRDHGARCQSSRKRASKRTGSRRCSNTRSAR